MRSNCSQFLYYGSEKGASNREKRFKRILMNGRSRTENGYGSLYFVCGSSEEEAEEDQEDSKRRQRRQRKALRMLKIF